MKDSREGHVLNVHLVVVRKCGLAMMNGHSYVRDSANAIAFKETDLDELVDEEVDDFDPIQSHPVECKCRSGRGFDRSLSQAESIQKKIVELGGLDYDRKAHREAKPLLSAASWLILYQEVRPKELRFFTTHSHMALIKLHSLLEARMGRCCMG